MKKLIICLSALLTIGSLSMTAKDIIVRKSEGAITFIVDKGLPKPEKLPYILDSDDLRERLLSDHKIPDDGANVLATSFDDAQLYYNAQDVLFQCMITAYADHHPLVLSPDMVWLAISQGFSRYVNAHAEALRPQIVDHDGKMTLVIESKTDLLDGEADWEGLMDGFAAQIGRYTKGDIATTIVADFSTTGPTERIASRITLMDAVKSFFDYQVIYIACGIPEITLLGTPADWQAVHDKAVALKNYGLDVWINKLEPVLLQFVKTAQGQPDRRFWQNIVKRKRVGELRGGGCSSEKPTELDGWFLTLFPDEQGKVSKSVPHTTDMPSEMVQVDFKYTRLSPTTGEVISETPMQLMAGFIGIEEDSVTRALTPRIGWLVRQGNGESDALNNLRKQNEGGSIDLCISEVPEMLRQLPRIKSLSLTFTGDVVLPEWMDQIKIDKFYVFSSLLTDDDKARLRQRFPNIKFSYLEDE